MAYTPTVWAVGDVMTATKLNKLENGIASAHGLVVNETFSNDVHTMNKTWQEISNTLKNGFCPVLKRSDTKSMLVMSAEYVNNTYSVVVNNYNGTVLNLIYTTNSASGYPTRVVAVT